MWLCDYPPHPYAPLTIACQAPLSSTIFQSLFKFMSSELVQFSSVQFSHLVLSDSLQPHESQQARPPCSSPTPGVYPNSCPLSQWCHPAISSSVVPFSSCPQSLPASGSFPINQFFAAGGQSIGASASTSVLLMNIQGWFSLGLTGLISLQPKGLSRLFTTTTVRKPSIPWCLFIPTLTYTQDYWKNHGLDYMDLCQQSDVSAF